MWSQLYRDFPVISLCGVFWLLSCLLTEDNGIWKIKTNKELVELIKHRNIINYVKAQRPSWFGHINRMPEIDIVKKICK
jgi:hypothetical protein